MLELIAIVLLLLWVFGYLGGYVISSFIHILLVAAIIILLVRIIER